MSASPPVVRVRWVGATDLTVLCLLGVTLPLLAMPSYAVGLAVMATLDLAVAAAVLWDYRRLRVHLDAFSWEWRVPALGVAGDGRREGARRVPRSARSRRQT